MPELPEVEVVRLGLEAHVVGRRIDSVVVLHDRPVRRHPTGAAGLVADLTGRTFTGACRRGKYLWLPLDNGDAVMAHLGMSGQMLIQPAAAPAERHLRVRFGLGSAADAAVAVAVAPDVPIGADVVPSVPPAPSAPQGPRSVREPGEGAGAGVPIVADVVPSVAAVPSAPHAPRLVHELREAGEKGRELHEAGGESGLELRFVDQRMFGGLWVSPGGAVLPAEIAHIARDPLDPLFDDALFVTRVRRSRSGIKRILLNQGVVSGVGNIYADEALWRAGLHGERAGERLSRSQVLALLDHVREVMREALAQGGTSFDALYVNVNGQSGYFDRSLNAYGRVDLPCRRCGTPMRRVAFMNRSSYFCPVCQPAPRRRAS